MSGAGSYDRLEGGDTSKLMMEKRDLENVPSIALPDGYSLRTYRSGDEAALARRILLAPCNDSREVLEHTQLRFRSPPRRSA